MHFFKNRLSHIKFDNNLLKYYILFCIAWYLSSCLFHLLAQRPLWLDEICVFKSVETFTFKQFFTEKLVTNQIFPRLYLFLIQQVSRPFNFDLIALRFLPFVSMIVAFFIWLKIASYEFKHRLEYLTFLLSWTASSLLIYYSAELKQYSMDVLTAAIFILFLYNQQKLESERLKKWYIPILIFLPSMGLLSYTSFLFMIFPFYNLIHSVRRDKDKLKYLIVYGCSFLMFLFLAYFFDIRLPQADVYTQSYQDYCLSFVSVGEFFRSLGEGLVNLFSRWLVERPRIVKKIGIFFMAFGFIYLFSGFFKTIKKRSIYFDSLDKISLILFLELCILGALKKYPFIVPRTVLFYCSIVLYLTVKGIMDTRKINKYFYIVLHSLYIIFLIILSVELFKIVLAGKLMNQPTIFVL